jgi:cytochrome P450
MNLLRRLFPRAVGALPLSATVDLEDPAVSADPVPTYEALRREGPVVYLPRHGFWLVLGYDAAKEVFSEPARFSSAPYAFIDPTMLAADPPRHGPVRKIVSRVFAGDTLRRLEALAAEKAHSLIQPRMEVVTGLARPVSRAVAADLLGLGGRSLEGVLAAEDAAEAAPHAGSFATICAAIDDVAPHASLFDRLRAEGADLLQLDEARSLVRLLWLASTATTERVIARAVLCLAEDQAMHRRLRQDPGLLAPFVDEVVRLYPPENLIRRRAIAATSLNGVSLPENAEIAVCLPAANRDPQRFAAPHDQRPDRTGLPALSFGYGIHHCVGGPMARRVVTAVIGVLVRASERVEIDAEMEWLDAMMVCAPKRLTVRL